MLGKTYVRMVSMIDDHLLELAADCYVALRAHGYLEEFPTFEGFLRLAIGTAPLERPALNCPPSSLSDLVAAPPPGSVSAN